MRTMRDLDGRVMLVTGATEGIGKAAALNFARRGARLTIVGRNAEKTARVLEELKAASGNADLDALLGDLSKLADVRDVAAKFKAKHDRLDVLVNNAGGIFSKPQTSAEGYELTFAVNHLAHFQLTVALLDLIRATPNARVISTSSHAHRVGNVDLATTPTTHRGFKTYATSKLANILFIKELARRLEGTTATANAFNPGYVHTGIMKNDASAAFTLLLNVSGRLFARTPEQGADTLVWLATAPECGALRGEYVSDRKKATVASQALDAKLATELWALSERLCAAA